MNDVSKLHLLYWKRLSTKKQVNKKSIQCNVETTFVTYVLMHSLQIYIEPFLMWTPNSRQEQSGINEANPKWILSNWAIFFRNGSTLNSSNTSLWYGNE